MYVYILLLQHDKYYVGHAVTENEHQKYLEQKDILPKAIESLDNSSNKDLPWISLHNAIKVVELIEDGNKQIQKSKTLEYMRKYGWENVRGYAWSQVILKYPPRELNIMPVYKTENIFDNTILSLKNNKYHKFIDKMINQLTDIKQWNNTFRENILYSLTITILPHKIINKKKWSSYDCDIQKNILDEIISTCMKKFKIEEIDKCFKVSPIYYCVNYHSSIKTKESVNDIINFVESKIGAPFFKLRKDLYKTIDITKINSKSNWSQHVENQYVKPTFINLDQVKNKKVLVLDLETTGLPARKEGIHYGKDEYCDYTDNSKYDSSRIIQIAWILVQNFSKTKMNEDDITEYLVKPNGFDKIDDEVVKIHGITYEKANLEGKKFKKIIKKYGLKEAIMQCDIIMGHTCLFDIFILLNECYRSGLNKCVDKLKQILDDNMFFCTAEFGRNVCKQKIGYDKFYEHRTPALKQLYFHYFKFEPEVQHDAKADVNTLLQIFNKVFNFKNTMTDDFKLIEKCNKSMKMIIVKHKNKLTDVENMFCDMLNNKN